MALRLKVEKPMVKDNTERVKNAESSIVQQANEIAARVLQDTFNALAGRVTNAEASLNIQADAIALKVSQSNFNALAERVDSAESSLSLQADAIALKVSSTDFTGNTIASLINQSAAEVKIQASKITLEGLITANNNFKVLADGSIEAVNAKLSGAITATKMVSTSNPAFYGEIGLSDGLVGLGLYDTRYDTGPYMRIVELASGSGFSFMDTNNIQRFSAQPADTRVYDRLGQLGLFLADASRAVFSPNGKNYIGVTDSGIQIVKDGVLKASW